MAEDKSIEFLDYIVLFVKHKKLFVLITILGLIVSYLTIYFFIKEEFEANAVVIPAEQTSLSPFSSLMKDFSKLPLNISGKSTSSNFFNTIVFSRSNLEKVISKFNLQKDYNVSTKSDLLKKVAKSISTGENEDGAFLVTVRANSPQRAADIANFVVSTLNEEVLSLNNRKTHENRVYLGKRYDEIKLSLKNSEDSLRNFQEKSGVLQADEQTKAMIENYAKLEGDMAAKEIEYSVVQKIYGDNTQQTQNAKISLDEFQKKVNEIKSGKVGNTFLQSISSLPQKAQQYLRFYRDVKIQNAMLEYIIPLYENAKYEEFKDVPVFQVVDNAVPPDKRVYPQRTLMSLIITLGLDFGVFLLLIFRQMLNNSTNEKVRFIKSNLINLKSS